jgi:filamentous hemagglutinin family protein
VPRVLALAVAAALGAPHASAAPPLPPGTIPGLRGVVSGAIVRPPVPLAAGRLLQIDQSAQRAIIDWNSFNIAAGSRVTFQQPNAGAAALNRIYDANPSIIQGQLTANGQVYLVNQNGIIFDRGSQVDVHTLVASTLGLREDVFLAGIGPRRDDPAFDGFGPGGPRGIELLGAIRTQAGGSVLVLAPQITSQGTISAPDGQIVLAAGEKVWLYSSSADDVSLRGLVVEFHAGSGPADLTSVVNQGGTLSADRGNVTIAALAINQANRITATTAALQNGSIHLKAVERGGARAGEVRLLPGSVTETPVDATDTTTLAEDQDFAPYRPRINIDAKLVHNQGTIVAPGGLVTLNAIDPEGAGGARVFLDAGSLVSAAGTWADVAASKNLLSIQLTSNELKDAPVQKGGPLQGETVIVDARVGTPLFDISGYTGAIKRSVAEKTATGGAITINSAADIVVAAGAVVDVSGGGYRYSGERLYTSKLLWDNRIIDIGAATPDRRYVALLDTFERTSQRWGMREVFRLLDPIAAAYSPPDVEGKAGGALTLLASGAVVVDGDLRGGATAGRVQIAAGRPPRGGRLVVGDVAELQQPTPNFAQTQVVFTRSGPTLAPGFGPADPLPAGLQSTTTLPLGFFKDAETGPDGAYRQLGFSDVELYARDRIAVAAGDAIRLPANGSLTLVAFDVDVAGRIDVPAGTIDLRGIGQRTSGEIPGVTLAAGARLGTAGLWINDAPNLDAFVAAPPVALPRSINGGTIRIVTGDAEFAAGSVVDVSSGARWTGSTLAGGNAGSISFRTGAGRTDDTGNGRLDIDADLRGYGAGRGGRLEVIAAGLQVGGTRPEGSPLLTQIGAGRFGTGGFAEYNLRGIGGVTVAAGEAIAPVADSLVVDVVRGGAERSGAALAGFSTIERLPEFQRAPVRLTIAATGPASDLVVEPGATIAAGVKGTVELSATQTLRVDGRVEAPAGRIAASVTGIAGGTGGGLTIGSGAYLGAPGYFLATPNSRGLRTGEVLRGGEVALSASNRPLAIEAGAVLDVSATFATVDVTNAQSVLEPVRTIAVAGDAGTIAITATERATIDGSLRGFAGGAGGAGGTFAFDLVKPSDAAFRGTDRRLVVTQAATPDRTPTTESVDGYLAADTLRAGGFDKLRLRAEGVLEFRGDVTLDAARSLTLDARVMRATDGARVAVASPRVAIGASPDALAGLALRGPTATTPGSARLDVAAGAGGAPGVLELFGTFTLNGFAEARFVSSGDIRMTGNLVDLAGDPQLPDALVGSLTTRANLTLTATQIYPTTYTDYTLRVRDVQTAGGVIETDIPGSRITVLPNGAPANPALSAGGRLALEAAEIMQAGTVKAPLGQIVLRASERATFASGSLTSVAGDQLTPYGVTENGQTWRYAGIVVSAPPAKRVELRAPAVDIQAGSTVDLRGGGETLAHEVVIGPGGSADTLLADATYAILPWAGVFGPVDTQLRGEKDLGFGRDRNLYDSVYLTGVPGLPDGTYPLLPGHYALLPGAYIVRPQTDAKFNDMAPGRTAALTDGTLVAAGRYAVAGTNVAAARWSGFAVEPGAAARTRSEYVLSTSAFFADAALRAGAPQPVLPRDPGTLAITASLSLALNGDTIAGGPPGARAAAVEIAASRIAVVGAGGSAPDGFLEIRSDALSRGDARVLLGGTRNAAGDRLDVTAEEILVATAGGPALAAPEVLLASKDLITVAEGSAIRGTGGAAEAGGKLTVDGPGALLRASAGGQLALTRTNAAPIADGPGRLVVARGAAVSADGALLLDASSRTTFDGAIRVAPGGALSLGARAISLGEVAGVTGGLVLGNAALGGFTELASLALRSYQTLDLYGTVTVGGGTLQSLTVDAGGLVGYPAGGAGVATLEAGTVALVNTSGATALATPGGTGKLTVRGDEVVIGSGAKTVSGFGTTTLDAAAAVVVAGAGSLEVAGNVAVQAGRIVGGERADQTITAAGTLATGYSARSPAGSSPEAAPGAKLGLTGAAIEHGGAIDLPSGNLTLRATAGDLALAAGSRIAADGYQKQFGPTTATASGGRVVLAADAGSIRVEAGARVSVSGAAGGGDAGRLELSAIAPGATVSIDGELAGAAGEGYASGQIAVDAAGLSGLGALNRSIDAGGFRERREFRARTGDLALASGEWIAARQVSIVADAGSIDVAGAIDASHERGGGRVALAAASGVQIRDGASIVARGSATGAGPADPYSDGGQVEILARGGSIAFAPGAAIDVSAGAKGAGGMVTFIAPRTGATVATDLRGRIAAAAGAGGEAGSVAVVGTQIHAVSGIDSSLTSNFTSGNAVWSDYRDFVEGVDRPAVIGGLQLSGMGADRVAVRAGIELQGSDKVTLGAAWDLTQPEWRIGGEPGLLTIRAAGDLELRSALGFPDDSLVNGGTWSIRLVGGADLASADPFAVRQLAALGAGGNVVLATAAAAVRTGTGEIRIAAGQDVRLANARAVVYTAGRPGPLDADDRFGTGGGDVIVQAQRDVTGPNAPLFVNDWFDRTPDISTFPGSRTPAGWWPNRPTVRQAFAALGGGDVVIRAGRDAVAVNALTPTSAIATGVEASASLEVRGGGDLAVSAGRNLVGGQYLVGRGRGTVNVGGDFGLTTPTGLFLIGEHSDPALRNASFRVEAVGDLALQNVSNPTIMALPARSGQDEIRITSNFFSYGPESGIDLRSLAGDIVLRTVARTRRSTVGSGNISTLWSDVAPPRFAATAFAGDIRGTGARPSNTRFRLFPSETGELALLAGGEIYNLAFQALDSAPSTLPQWSNPIDTLGQAAVVPAAIVLGPLASERLVTPNPAPGYPYELYAGGDIADVSLEVPQRARIEALGDIGNLQADLQNTRAEDVTLIRAGGDIAYRPTLRNGLAAGGYVRIGGAGRLLLQAGRGIDLGTTEGVTAGGNAFNAFLPSTESARVTAIAGVTGDVDLARVDAFFVELLAAGLARNTQRASAAADALFDPARTSADGDLTMYFSSIRTTGGSGIDILVPGGVPGSNSGGNINAGLPSPSARDIGLLTILGGGIRAYSANSFNVNQSKVATLQGGDILLYSRYRDIDAGRGARDARTTSPPRRIPITAVDPNTGNQVETGLFAYLPPLDAAGSGIRTFTSDPDGPGPLAAPKPGDVFLFAPLGTINAGEAGIASAGNVVVVATQVLNAQNISASGTATGVPVSSDGAAAGALAATAGAAAAATQSIAEAARDATQPAAQDESFRPSFLTIEVLGFGT